VITKNDDIIIITIIIIIIISLLLADVDEVRVLPEQRPVSRCELMH
jgi:hypothetical protein